MNKLIALIGLSISLVLCGCASPPIDSAFRPMPAMLYPKANLSVYSKISTNNYYDTNNNWQPTIIAFDALEHPETSTNLPVDLNTAGKTFKSFLSGLGTYGNAVYLSVDVSPLEVTPNLIHDTNSRNNFMQLVMQVSDRNFGFFMSRSLAFNNYRGFYGGLVSNAATAGSGVAAFFSPITSAGLSLFNLSSATTAINTGISQQLLENVGMDTIFNDAQTARLQLKDKLKTNMAKPMEDYGVYQVLDDLGTYDQYGNLLMILNLEKIQSGNQLLNQLQSNYAIGLTNSSTGD